MQEANENFTDKQRNRLYKSRIIENVGIYCVINFVLGISKTCVYLLLHAKVASVKKCLWQIQFSNTQTQTNYWTVLHTHKAYIIYII